MNSNKKKVMFVIPRMGAGGAERVVSHIANSLCQLGHQVKIVTLVSDKSFYPLEEDIIFKSAMINVNRNNILTAFFSLTNNFLTAFHFIRKEIKSFQPNSVISMLIETDILTYLVGKSGLNFKHICSERNDPSKRNIFLRKLLYSVYKSSDHFVCQSKTVAKYYSDKFDNNIRIIPNPINPKLIPQRVKESSKLNLVSVGRLAPQKNFTLLINSFFDISNDFPDCTLTIYGEGPKRNELENLIKKYNLENRIFLPGYSKDILNDIKDSSIFVMSSNYEGFPNVLIEAMAVGLPIISTDFSTGVARELIENNNGILVPVNNRKAMGSAIKKLLSNKTLRIKMRRKNPQVINDFDLNKIISLWQNLIL